MAEAAAADDGLLDVGGEVPPTQVPAAEGYTFLSSKRHGAGETAGWESLAVSEGWTATQTEFLGHMGLLLDQARLIRLAHHGTKALQHPAAGTGGPAMPDPSEAVSFLELSRVAEQILHLFAEYGFDTGLISWANATLLDTVDRELANVYVDLLRHLRLKIPAIMEEAGLLDARGSRRLGGSAGLKATVAKGLDQSLAKSKLPKLDFEVPPVFVLAPCESTWASGYLLGWRDALATLGKVFTCQETAAHAADRDGMVKLLQRKIKETRQKNSKKPLVVVGYSVGAKVAAEVCAAAKVQGLVCLAPTLETRGGPAADPNRVISRRHLLRLKCPTAFVVGTLAQGCPDAALQQTCAQMPAATRVIAVQGGGDDLHVGLGERLQSRRTQLMIDREACLDIGRFLLEHCAKTADRKRPASAEDVRASVKDKQAKKD